MVVMEARGRQCCSKGASEAGAERTDEMQVEEGPLELLQASQTVGLWFAPTCRLPYLRAQ